MDNIAFFGATKFSQAILECLIENKFGVRAIFSIGEVFITNVGLRPNCNYADMREIAKENGIEFSDLPEWPNNPFEAQKTIRRINPDLVLVMGWYHKIPNEILKIPKHGVWAIHASLLPKYAGGAPLVWAIINGEKETGVTLFRMNEKIDTGDIIAQKSFPIEPDDTIKEVYEKATQSSKEILIKTLKEGWTFTPQKGKLEVYPQRTPKDGKIYLCDHTAESLHNFIRAQSEPYPGAYFEIGGKKLIIEKARVE